MLGGSTDPISVFVRVRPLTPQEVETGTDALPGIATETKLGHDAVAIQTDNALFDGFSGVIAPTSKNEEVFEKCFADRIPVVVRGGFASAFSYGYTGGGKTHTMIGYGEEKGMYRLATERLLSVISGREESDPLFLHATACEVYGDKIFDLLGAEKLECSLKVDAEGELQVVGAVDTSDDLTCKEKGQFSEEDFPEHLRQLLVPADSSYIGTLTLRTLGLRSLAIRKAEDLDAISQSCVQKRASGESTEHTQSSRSHAVLKMEVVTQRLVDARAKARAARARVHPALSAANNASKFCLSQIADIKRQAEDHAKMKFSFTLQEKGVAESLKSDYSQVQSDEGLQTDNSLVQWYSSFGWWKIISQTKTTTPAAEAEVEVQAGAKAEAPASAGMEVTKYVLEVNGECDGVARTLEDWQIGLRSDWKRMEAEEAEIQQQLAIIESAHSDTRNGNANADDAAPVSILPASLASVVLEPPGDSDSEFELVVGSFMPYLRDFGPDFKSRLQGRELQADIMRKQAGLKARADALEAEAKLAEAEVDQVLEAGQPALGGALLFVDLAGADYDHRQPDGQQQRESIAINKSLLTLKECLRSLVQSQHQNQNQEHGECAKRQKAPFRGTKITRLLEDALAPSSTSKRRNKESVSLMLVNVSPNAQLEKMTLNSLRYGQMYVDASTPSQGEGSKGKHPARVHQEVLGKAAGKGQGGFASMDPDEARGVLMGIYKTHCPEKTEQDVGALLAKFVGRERTLIQKVRNKYGA